MSQISIWKLITVLGATMATLTAAHADGAADAPLYIHGTYVAQADKEKPKELSAKCAAFRQDLDANIGTILKAGCEPSLAQMSKLMDNPLGNVAMLFTQGDWTRLEMARAYLH